MRTQEPVAFEEYFEPLTTWFEVTAYPSVDGLSVFFRDVTERRERQRVRTDLLATSRRLMQAETVERVAEVMSEAAAEVLGLELHMVRLYDPETDQLVPAAGTDDSAADVPDREAYGLDAGPAGEAFRTGEPIVVDNLAAYDDHPAYEASSRGPLAAAMYLPLGEYGTLNATSREQGAFSEEDVQLAELLTTVATAALERADREQTLRRYEQIIETVRGMVYATDATGEVTFVTERLAALLGYDQAELLGVSTRTVIPDDQLATVEAELAALDREPPEGSTPAARESGTRRFEIDLRRADGDRVPVEIEVSALDGPAGGRVGVVRDLSELRTTQQRLDTERERLSYLFEALPDPVVEVRRTDGGETVVTAVNDAFTARFDVDASDVVGRPPDGAILGEGAALLTHLPTVDSTPSDPTAEFDVRTPDGRRYFLFRGAPYTAGGDARGFGILTDVTTLTRRGRHLAVLNRVFRHNFRNELNVVQGYAELLAEGVTDDDLAAHAETVLETTRSLTKLSDTAQRIQTVVDETPADRRALNPAAVVDAAADAAGVSVALDADASVPSVAADDRLELVLTELLENARDHGVEPIEVTIDGAADGTEVRIEVRDHGPGIDDVEWAVVTGDREITQLEHGSGLGLWLATLLVEQYGGELQNRSTDDVTALALVLPAASRRTDGAS
jgi:PAS domain S-box-containing protein